MERSVEKSAAPGLSLQVVARQLELSRQQAKISYGQLAEVTGYGKSTLHRALTGKRCSREVAEAVAQACGARLDDAVKKWLETQGQYLSPPEQTDPNSIQTRGDLQTAMQKLLSASRLSLRQLELRAGIGILPKTTVNEAIRGKRTPSENLLLAFVHTLGSGYDSSTWAAARQRAVSGRNVGWKQSHEPMLVTPTPRVLSVLGDIEMSEFNCFAELVDNFMGACIEPGSAPLVSNISITFDGMIARRRQGSVVIRDNGPGMDRDTLTRAVSLGWAGGKDREIFGLGFNVATARLGSRITVRSARVESSVWTVLTLDLPAMARSGEWSIPVMTQEKIERDDHGTEITVTGLREPWRESKGRMLRTWLGDLYSFPLRSGTLAIEVNGRQVAPRLPCIWAESRSVPRRSGDVGAVISIDTALRDAAFCSDCQHSGPSGLTACSWCDSLDLVVRKRRVKGWIGVQRYLDSRDYGIDFLWNGRKILRRDKSMFAWEDSNSLTSHLEYPLELGNQGRIVGEIHCDHIPVSYTKQDFHRESPEWKAVVAIVRGEGPLRPQIGKRYGYPLNESPLAAIFRGFSRNDPGLRNLIPGDGMRAIHAEAAKWGDLFRAGIPEYQSDEIWYQAALTHDRVRSSEE
ncbi:XRE family transcriptional regulator [Streptomyces endophyticus]|uniref:Helix-turn-helix domain-containing protein n=1 Tax=Streptomyces endophyticus TaxID=714166 RepID=A0ABU6FK04_9ACTN|nr:XRE family transcriptional regulator [Streptomyces endophyticus]MEB8343922.1 helix-turn-helix domain-containing protein [Streptomyces endophyticus]